MNRSVREKSRDYQWFKDTGVKVSNCRFTKKMQRHMVRMMVAARPLRPFGGFIQFVLPDGRFLN